MHVAELHGRPRPRSLHSVNTPPCSTQRTGAQTNLSTGFVRRPAWSPDGRRIAFSTRSSGNNCYVDYRIAVIDVDGTNRYEVSSGPVDCDPCLGKRHDCSSIVGEPVNRRTSGRLYAVNPDRAGSDRLVLSTNRGKYEPAIRASDGSIVVDINASSKEPGGLFLTTVRGGAPRRAHRRHGVGRIVRRVFSPDGSRLLFISDRSGHLGAWVLDLADGSYRQVNTGARTEYITWSAAWSPTGDEIATLEEKFDRSRGGDLSRAVIVPQFTSSKSSDFVTETLLARSVTVTWMRYGPGACSPRFALTYW